MKHHLDFEKPIVELQRKLEELRRQPETRRCQRWAVGAGGQGEALLSTCVKMGPPRGSRFKPVCAIWQGISMKCVFGPLSWYGQKANSYVDYHHMLRRGPDLDVILVATPHCCRAAPHMV